ncbi:pantoate--beta-alanine ligase [Bacillus alveayuensis]|jgi:pantoate--beta-alanine ligase|uniref:pantoate--beta-alanine ligase n=1 Tax=Aeribacillus alveayuensis TaxID=279215 RepID=UPI0005CD741C|nr:pantoate--beta-alanine ligase [Bacillus alveayuensis]
MKVVQTIHELRKEVERMKKEGLTIGFVPTMGFLHEGHLTLIERAKLENDQVVLSIFVNPLQFGPNEDFETYPRDLKRDEKLAAEKGVNLIFAPSVKEMYPHELSVSVHVKKRVNVLCGRKREGHFDGVATVLTKLFHLIEPNRAYFGMKDAQQVAVVDGLIKDFHFPIELVPVETVREEDGLAKSSRNVRLLPEERKEARHLYQSLILAKELIECGERNPETIIKKMEAYLKEHVRGKIDYIEIYSYPELLPIHTLKGTFIIALAVRFQNARLIDNITMDI